MQVKWHEHLTGTKARGTRGKTQWSLGCLCVDVKALNTEYLQHKKAPLIDYTNVLKWAVTDDAAGLSRVGQQSPLPISSKTDGRYIRIARLWDAAPEVAIDSYDAEELAEKILVDHGAPMADVAAHKRAVGAVIIALRDVKQTRVTYLELSQYEEAHSNRETYNDAIVNIFTRLNTAGRTLTREDITYAWLKTGWNTTFTAGENAKSCIDTLRSQLEDRKLPIDVEDIISAISFIWSTSFNAGKLLNNNDLIRGEAIRPMAANISENWDTVVNATTLVCDHATIRDLHFRQQYQSVNALTYLWAWTFCALLWKNGNTLKEVEKDAFDKQLSLVLDRYMDRWLICSQWSGEWASSTNVSLAKYSSRLAHCALSLQKINGSVDNAIEALSKQLAADIEEIETAAIESIERLDVDDRSQVRTYYTPLWIWNRLDESRWKNVQIALRQGSKRKANIEVDHIVAFDLWNTKLQRATRDASDRRDDDLVNLLDSMQNDINELGNCMLLEKNFNISKSNSSAKEFLETVHEFKSGSIDLKAWAEALGLDMDQIDCNQTPVETLQDLFSTRSRAIKSDLAKFIRGTLERVDVKID